jgi:hypothetical protein
MAQAVSGLSLWRPSFKSNPVYLGLLVDKMALAQVFLQVVKVSSVCIVLPILLSPFMHPSFHPSTTAAV